MSTNIVPTLSGRRHGTQTAEEQEASIVAARRRIKAGYIPPEMPETSGVWTPEFDEFAKAFQHLLKQRLKDSDTVNASYEEYRTCADAHELLKVAVYGKDLPLILNFQRLIIDSKAPENIEPAAKALAVFDREAELTHEHVEAYTEIITALRLLRYEETRESSRMSAIEMESFALLLSILCFEDMSRERVVKVVELIQRGVIDPIQVRASLKSFEGVSTPLVDGAL